MGISLKIRMTIFFLFILAFVVVAQHIIANTFILNQYSKIEEKDTTDKIKIIINYISKGLDQLVGLSTDWGAWDATYQFIDDLNEDYINENLVDRTFYDNRWNFFVLVRSNGEIAYKKSYQIDGVKQSELPEDLYDFLNNEDIFLHHQKQGMAGIVQANGQYFLTASHPVLTSTLEGEAKGTLMVGRLIDNAWIDRLVSDLQLNVRLRDVNDQEMTEMIRSTKTFQQHEARYLGTTPFIQQTSIEDELSTGYIFLKSIDGKHAFVLEFQKNMGFYQKGKENTLYFLASLALIIGITFLYCWSFLNKHILSRLNSMKQQIEHIERLKDFSQTLPLSKHGDEITFLENEFNSLISSVNKSYNELKHKAHHDPLTGLPNRECFYEKVEHLMKTKYGYRLSAILYIDLDGFKAVNDTYGHHIGDLLLKQIGQLFLSIEREDVIVSRIGGDEFLLFLPNLKNKQEAEQFAEKLIQQLKSCKRVQHDVVEVSASIGISFYPEHSTDLKTLIKCADETMYTVKHQDKDGFNTYFVS